MAEAYLESIVPPHKVRFDLNPEQITVTRRPAVQLGLVSPTPVWLDGEPVGEARNLSLRLEPDALICIV